MTEERLPRMSSVLGETAIVIGNVKGAGDLEIRGRVQGSVNLDGRVLISESGVVLGGIEAKSITVAGDVRGDLIAEDGVEVQALGRVEGNVEAPRVGIEAGARVRGMLRTGSEPSKQPEERDAEKEKDKKILLVEEDQAPLVDGAPSAREPEAKKSSATSPEAQAQGRSATKPKKRRRRKGPPPLPTFEKGARGRAK